eukprot:15452238-Alexandrium_andersonii.AAC.1
MGLGRVWGEFGAYFDQQHILDVFGMGLGRISLTYLERVWGVFGACVDQMRIWDVFRDAFGAYLGRTSANNVFGAHLGRIWE